MERDVICAIIGAGPAGSACGIQLQKSGISNCLIDRAVFPRNKTCGGLVTEKTRQLMLLFFTEKELETLFTGESDEVTVFEKTEPLAKAAPLQPFHFVDRQSFDHALVGKYQEAGGILFSGETDYRINYEKKTILLSAGKTIRYRYLLFADGMCSQSHHLFRGLKKETAFGIETFVPAADFPVKSVGLHFGFLANGYVWVFPKGEDVCIGLGNTYEKGFPYRETLTTVIKALGLSPDGLPFHGAFLPYGKAIPQEELPDEILLLGDAAGFADPISGEGLYFALQSGRFAAESLAGYQAEIPGQVKKNYLRKTAEIRDLIKSGTRLQKFFFRPQTQKRFLRMIRNRNAFLKFYLDEHVSFYHYSHSRMLKLMLDYKKRR